MDGAVCRPDSNLSPSLARGEEDPDRWGPPVSERRGNGRGSRPRGGIGPGKRSWAARRKEGKKPVGWAVRGERGGE
jgi:hypothetical protein